MFRWGCDSKEEANTRSFVANHYGRKLPPNLQIVHFHSTVLRMLIIINLLNFKKSF